MNPSRRRLSIPLWLYCLCAIIPNVALLVACIALAFGVEFNAVGFTGLLLLSARVFTCLHRREFTQTRRIA